MTAFLLASGAMLVAALALLTRPWWPRPSAPIAPAMTDPVSTLRQQIQQLDALRADGSLSEAAHADARAALERQLVDQVLTGAAPTSAPATAAARGPTVRTGWPWRRLVAVTGVLAVVAVAGTVLLDGSGGLARLSDGPSAGGSAAAGGADPVAGSATDPAAAHELGADQIAAMAERLSERLKTQPDDVDGWSMLARSYAMIGRHADAVSAFRKAVALRADDAVLLADFADALAMTQQRKLAGEPLKLVQQALKLEPANLKALSLAGTEAFDRQDFAAALRYWETLQASASPDNVFVRQVQGGIDEARQRAGLPARTAAAGGASSPAAAPNIALATGSAISGTVTLAAALKNQVAPTDTVFVFARPPSGSRMPLAILRKQVKDLPLSFTLDDSLSMSPAARLSDHATVVVGARISKSGQAMPQAGDLQGLSTTVALGSSGVKVDISEAVAR
jgi:cytochrome c-type biogenesis protein CcmH